jgi:hypothetical protein
MTGDELRAVLTRAAPQRTPRNRGIDPTDEHRANSLAARRQNIKRSVPHRWDTILTLDLAGWSSIEIAEHIRMTPSRVSFARSTERYKEEKARRLTNLDHDFVSLKPLAINALRQGLVSTDENAALRASEQWFKTAGYGSHGQQQDAAQGLTAEGIAAAIVRQSVSVTVNIDRDSIATLGIEEPHVRIDHDGEERCATPTTEDRAGSGEPQQ